MSPPVSRAPDIAVTIPAKNEEEGLPGCLAAIDVAAARYSGSTMVVVVANDCDDRTVQVLEQARLRHARLVWTSVSLLPGFQHAGWARRFALDAAADLLPAGEDILMCTDADTEVDQHWVARNADYLAGGADAVAGRALTRRDDRRALGDMASARLNMLGRYYTVADYLRTARDLDAVERWPRHYYEGGASIALTKAMYLRIGRAPTPTVGEDRALFGRVRSCGGSVRHPIDVRVFTSCRLNGRAPGGMADTFRTWIAQSEHAPLHETYRMEVAAHPDRARPEDRLTFATLPQALREAQAMLREERARASDAAPDIEPILVPPVARDLGHLVAQRAPEDVDSIVAAERIVGEPGPVHQHDVTA